MPNRLQHETSPYLLQHKDNPVDWYPWGPAALEAADAQDKPILLSIGYSACHWCHVMEHESFEDEATARYMNQQFVNIKVDREERPDLDDIYMQATLIFNRGNGGWPMTVFLTPEGKPFHAGTYFPPEPRHGMPSFRMVMEAAVDAFRTRRKEVERTANSLTTDLARSVFDGLAVGGSIIAPELLDNATQSLLAGVDPLNGGLSRGRPKFPNPIALEFLLRQHVATGNPQALQVVVFTLRKMHQGGIYDQLGGGFHRYSVDEKWFAPHFEKMLYDNAQLARVALHAWQITAEPFLRELVEDTLDYVMREMVTPDGGFCSTQDADSEGEEGKFFTWSVEELRAALGDGVVSSVDALLEYWGVLDEGNFEGRNILHVADMVERVAVRYGLDIDAMRDDVEVARTVLYTLRKERVAPGRDDKVLAAWNGMQLAAFAEAARVLKRDDYQRMAEDNAQFLLRHMMTGEMRLWRTYKDGVSKINGYLEDYAHVIDGLLELYMTTFNKRWYNAAQKLADIVLAHFRAPQGGFFDTSDDHEALIVRPRNVQDNATPSGSGQFAYDLLRLAAFSAETRYEQAAVDLYRSFGSALSEYPLAFSAMLIGVDFYLRRPIEIAIIGDANDERTQGMLDLVRGTFRPTAVVALSPTEGDSTAIPPLLRARKLIEGVPAAYVCENFVCAAPVTTVAALNVILEDFAPTVPAPIVVPGNGSAQAAPSPGGSLGSAPPFANVDDLDDLDEIDDLDDDDDADDEG